MEKVKENAALSSSCSNGVASCQERVNREAANGDNLLRMTVTGKIQETIMDLHREYCMNALPSSSTSSLSIRAGRLNRS